MDEPKLFSLTLGQVLDRTIAAYPDNDAVVYTDRNFRLTYREFGNLVDRLAKGLMALGVQRGRRLPYGPPMFPTGWCSSRLGQDRAILVTGKHPL